MLSQIRHGRGELVALILLLVLVFLVFAPVLSFDLLWDDLKIATDQAKYRVVDTAELNEQLSTALPFSPNYWRPLPMATFLWQINSGLSGSLLMHLASLIFHSLNVVVLFKLLGLMKIPEEWSCRATTLLRFVVAAAFAVHPLMVEPVAWVSSRFDLMMTLFSLLLMFVLFGMRESMVRLALVFGLMLAALLCKEQAVMLLPAYPFLVVLFGRGDIRRTGWQRVDLTLDRRAYGMMAMAFLVYLGLRWKALGYLLLPESLGFDLDLVQHLLVFGATAFHAWGLMLVPFGWAGEFHYLALPVSDSDSLLWMQTAASLLLLALTAMALFQRPRVGLLGAALAVVWLSILPVVNLKPLVTIAANMLIGERFMVLPTALLCLGVFALLTNSERNRNGQPWIAAAGLSVFMVAGLIASRLILPTWHSEIQLWHVWLETAPRVTWLRTNVSRELLLQERFPEAEAMALEAIEELDALTNLSQTRRWELGRALSTASIAAFEQGKSAKAIALMEQAAKRDVSFAPLYRSLLARYYLRLDNIPAAQKQMVQVVRLSQYQKVKRMPSISYVNLALLALDRRDWQSAGLLFREGYYNLSGGAWATDLPGRPEAWMRLSADLAQAKLPRAAALAEAAAQSLVAVH